MIRCKLCGKLLNDQEITDEHYPAHSVGNDDIVAFNITGFLDLLIDEKQHSEILSRMSKGERFNDIAGDIFDNKLSKTVYPKGRTAKTLCRECNSFLGKYDEAYLKFYSANGDPKIIRGFQTKTKIMIIKAIYGKFISIPEAQYEQFDFIDFVKNPALDRYDGNWQLYFIKRDFSTDLMGFGDLSTGALDFDEGIVYELSDDRFIFDLLNFEKHPEFKMTNIFDILSKNYNLTIGAGESGGYHAQVLMQHLFSRVND